MLTGVRFDFRCILTRMPVIRKHCLASCQPVCNLTSIYCIFFFLCAAMKRTWISNFGKKGNYCSPYAFVALNSFLESIYSTVITALAIIDHCFCAHSLCSTWNSIQIILNGSLYMDAKYFFLTEPPKNLFTQKKNCLQLWKIKTNHLLFALPIFKP